MKEENVIIFFAIGVLIGIFIDFLKPWWSKKHIKNKLRKQSNQKNSKDLKNILHELNTASHNGEYEMTVQLKANQVSYLISMNLQVEKTSRIGYYKISW